MPHRLSPLTLLNKYKRLIFGGIVIFVSFIVLEYSFLKFQIRKIEAIGPKMNALRGIEKYKNYNLLLLNPKVEETNLYNDNPFLKSISVRKVYPDYLQIIYTVYKPIALLKISEGTAAMSPTGRILYKERDRPRTGDLPIINLYQLLNFNSVKTGEVIERTEIKKTLIFLQRILDLNMKVENIDIDGQNMILFKLNEQSIFFSTEKDENKQIYELQTIIRQFKIEGKKFKVLDLRFDKPIVTF